MLVRSVFVRSVSDYLRSKGVRNEGENGGGGV